MISNETEEVNKRQKEFYETKKKNFATKIWSYFRNGLLNQIRKDIGIERQIYELHKQWFGDLSNKKVLDLGAYSGNSLSLFLAQNAREYIAVDLSEKGIFQLSERLKGLPNSKAVAIDFLSNNFTEQDFDLIYAYGVLHHFKDVQNLIDKLNEKLSPIGQIISYDPLETSIPLKIARNIYRPFQTDKDWEWPFTKKVYFQFKNAFHIIDKRAVLGKSKWVFLLGILPISKERKVKIAHGWHKEDWENSHNSDQYIFGCMHLTMLMEKRN